MQKPLAYSLCSAIAGVGVVVACTTPAQAFTFGSSTPSTGTVGNVGNYTSISTVGISGQDLGKSFSIDWRLPEAGDRKTMSATGLFTVNSFTKDLLNLTVKLTNTTASSFQAALMSMGLGVSLDSAKASYTSDGSKFDGMTSGAEQNFPGGFKNIDVCIFAANGCNGGNIKQGVQSGGESDTFTFNILGAFGAQPSVTLDSFAIKFQTQAGSFEFPGSPVIAQALPQPQPSQPTNPPPPVVIKSEPLPQPPRPKAVPEPGSIAGLGTIASLIALRRRKAK
jgi:hypothetical protein